MLWNARNGEVPLGSTGMSYVSFGYGDRVLLLLPGLSDGLATVKGKALLLAKPFALFFEGYTVFMFSRKDHMPQGYSIREMARDQAEAMDRLGIGTACVLGVSQGGMIAQYLAIDCPERVEKLVLAVTAPRVNPMIRDCVTRWMGLARQGRHKELMMDTAEKTYSERYLKKYRRFYPLLGWAGRPKNYERFLINGSAILGFDAWDQLHRIVCPTLILGGEADRTVGVQASYEMREQIAGSELYVYPGLGHGAYEEAEDFYPRVFRFLEGNGGTHE